MNQNIIDIINRIRNRTPNPGRTAARVDFDLLAGFDAGLRHMTSWADYMNVRGVSNSSYESAMHSAQMGLRAGSFLGLQVAAKFVTDFYRYTTMPAFSSMGLISGKYGESITSYFQTRGQIDMQYRMMGMQVGGMLGAEAGNFLSKFVGKGLMTSGLRTVGTGAAEVLSGVGVIPGLITMLAGAAQIGLSFIGKAAVVTATTAAGAYLGQKAGGKLAEGQVEKYGDMQIGSQMFTIAGDQINLYKTMYSTMLSRGGSTKSKDMLAIIQKNSRNNLLFNLNMNQDAIAGLMSGVAGSTSLKGEAFDSTVGYIGRIKGLYGNDITTTLAGISNSGMVGKEVNALSEAFETFLSATVGGNKITSVGITLAKNLAEYATNFQKSNFNSTKTDTLFAGVQKYMQKNILPANQTNTSRAANNINSIQGLVTGFNTSRFSRDLANTGGYSYLQSQEGVGSHPELMNTVLNTLGNRYSTDKLSINKDKTLNFDKGNDQYFGILRDFTQSTDTGGAGLTTDAANELIKMMVSYKKNGPIDFTNNKTGLLQQEASVDNNVKADLPAVVALNAIKISLSLAKESVKYLDKFVQASGSVLDYFRKHGALLAAEITSNITGFITGTAYQNGKIVETYTADIASYAQDLDPTKRTLVDTTTIGWQRLVTKFGVSKAASIKTALENGAAQLGVDPNWMASIYQIESSWVTNVNNGSYSGLNQISNAWIEAHRDITGGLANYLAMSAEQQIQVSVAWYKSFKLQGKMKSVGDMYLMTAATSPAWLTASDDTVIFRGNHLEKNNAVGGNPKWNQNKDDVITKGEIMSAIPRDQSARDYLSTMPASQRTITTPTTLQTGNYGNTTLTGKDVRDSGVHTSIGDIIAKQAVYNVQSKFRNTGEIYNWRNYCARFARKVLEQVNADPKIIALFAQNANDAFKEIDRKGMFLSDDMAKNLQVGDILVSGDGSGHVATYIGNGQVAQAGVTSDDAVIGGLGLFGSERFKVLRVGQTVAAQPKGKPTNVISQTKFQVNIKGLDKKYVAMYDTTTRSFVVKLKTTNGYKTVTDKKTIKTIDDKFEAQYGKNSVSEQGYTFYVSADVLNAARFAKDLTARLY